MARVQKYEQEIEQQPAVLQALLREERRRIEAIAEEIRRVRPSYGLLAGRGSSDNAGRYAQYVLGVRNRLVCALATPSVSTLYDSPPDMGGSLTIGLSQSGQSPDIVRVVEAAAEQGAMTVAVTNDSASPLAQAAGHVIRLHAGAESAVPATKTYTAELLAIAMLSVALQPTEEAWATLEQLPRAVQETLNINTNIAGIDELRSVEHLVVIGRGFNYASAFEIALKLSETSSVLAQPFSSADFFHGPVAMLGPETLMILVAPRGEVDPQLARLLAVVEQRKSRLAVISDDDQLLDRGKWSLRLPNVPEWVSPISAIIAGQLFSAALAEVKMQEPDAPKGLTKVTRTY